MLEKKHLLGTMIRDGREKLGLTQEEMAEKLQVNLTHYGNIERGNNNPSLTLFFEIMQTLHLSVDAYLYPENKYPNDIFQDIIRMLSQCSEKELNIIRANIQTLIDNRDVKPNKNCT